MIAAAAAGADVVDVAIDSKSFDTPLLSMSLQSPFRHVRPDVAATHGSCELGLGADWFWHWHPLR
jgi:hypothetical protein